MAKWRHVSQLIYLVCAFGFALSLYAEWAEPSDQVSLEQAIKIGLQELKRRSYRYGEEDLKAIVDENNLSWKRYIKQVPEILDRKDVREMKLDERPYWVVTFIRKLPPNEISFGGATVFVDRETGKVLGVLFGE
jgi:hypothetical protein